MKNIYVSIGSLTLPLELSPQIKPDLSPQDFYLSNYQKAIVHATTVNDVAELQQRVKDGCELIPNTSRIF
jgi:hypothetical protein